MNKAVFILASAVLMLASCVSSQFIPGTTKTYSPYTGIVAILYEPPAEEYEVIGTIVARGEDVGLSDVLRELRRKTAEVGGNAVIIRQSGKTSSGAVAVPLATGGFIIASEEIHEVVGTAILI